MTPSRIALVTGANQGLGRALVETLAAHMDPQDRILLTGRDPERVRAAAAATPTAGARIEGRVLDVRDGDAIDALAAELGEVDIVFSNATARMSPDADPADEVDAVAETSNVATSRMLRAFAARLRPGGRLIVVASALGTLDKLDARVRPRFDGRRREPRRRRRARRRVARRGPRGAGRAGGLRDVAEHPVQGRAGRRRPRGRARTPGRRPRGGQARRRALPGLIDTDASRPWFADMSQAQTPAEAAAWPVELVLGERFDPGFYGELVQFGRVIPWGAGIATPGRTAVAYGA